MSFKDKLKAKSAGLGAAVDAEMANSKPVERAHSRTAVGQAGAFQLVISESDRRIAELEEKIRNLEETSIPLASIGANPWQPRRVFDEDEIQRLADSIAEIGLIQPIVVRSVGNPNTFEVREGGVESVGNPNTFQIVSGERRLRAQRLLGLDATKAVVVEISDEEMALMAMAENINRTDLTAYEISLAIRSVQAQFKTIKRLAESVGINRTELYKYLSFADLPSIVQADLELSPAILGRDAAMDIMAVIKKHGQPAIDILLKLWPHVKSGDLDQGKIASLIEATVTRGEPIKTDRDIKKLFIGKDQAGSMTRDSSGFTIKIKAAALTPEKETELRSYVERMFGGTA
jgi:ParB family chromosome partitioning protein